MAYHLNIDNWTKILSCIGLNSHHFKTKSYLCFTDCVTSPSRVQILHVLWLADFSIQLIYIMIDQSDNVLGFSCIQNVKQGHVNKSDGQLERQNMELYYVTTW